MKAIILIIILVVVAGCHPEGDYKPSPRDKAVDACIKQGGVPIIDGWGDVKECQFPGDRKGIKQ